MRLICPSCGAIHSAEAWVNDADARQCLLIVAELPAEVGRRALPYLAMFRPSGSGRALTWSKALRLLAELKQVVSESFIYWDRCPERPNSAGAWAGALEQIVQRPPKQLPLTSHGYLRKIAYDIADQADKAAEVRRNKAERCGIPAGEPSADRTEEKPWFPSPEDIAKQKALLSKIGRKI
jgi:hypothetical protein